MGKVYTENALHLPFVGLQIVAHRLKQEQHVNIRFKLSRNESEHVTLTFMASCDGSWDLCYLNVSIENGLLEQNLLPWA